MRIVTIAALDEALVYAMVEGHAELRLLLKVAAVAKLRLSFNKQEFPSLCMVRRMAGDATDTTFGVLGIDRIHVLGAAGMACQATLIDLFRRMFLEDENLCFIAAAGNVGPAWTMAPLAALLGRASARVIQCFPVRSLLPLVVNIFVAGFARICSHIIRGIWSRDRRLVLGWRQSRMNRVRGLCGS